jgi:uncharacterized protein YegL
MRLETSVEFAENPEPRCACVLLLDTSGSMGGAPVPALNEGLTTFKDTLAKDPVASKRVEIAIVTFHSNVRLLQDFVTIEQFNVPAIGDLGGATLMSAGINIAQTSSTEELEQAFRVFLGSTRIRDRSDDDLTLVLAHRM